MFRLFSLDFETFCIVPGLQAPPPVCGTIAWDYDEPLLLHARGELLWQNIHKALTDKNTVILAHNAAFEVAVLMAYRKEWTPLIFQALREGRIRCTRVREKLIRIARGDRTAGFALDDLCEAYGLPMVDKGFAGRTRYGLLWDTPLSAWKQEDRDYALGDICVRDIYARQERVNSDWLLDQHAQMRARVSLTLTSCWGFPVDRALGRKLLVETKAKLEEYRAQILDAGLARYERKKGQTVVVKDTKAAAARLNAAFANEGREAPRNEPTLKQLLKIFDENTEPHPRNPTVPGLLRILEENGIYPEGTVKLDEESCRLSGDPLMLAYAQYGQAGTLLSKFNRLTKTPIQTFYDELKATGRTSSLQGDDPEPGEPFVSYGMQVQNLPRVGAEIEEET